MAVFRVEKTQNYTIMSNHHLRNNILTLKAKGLLSQMLSLPENWDYTLKGLSLINRESVEAIRTAVLELEKSGYIVRSQQRDSKGRVSNIEYIIYEQPQNSDTRKHDNTDLSPSCDFPITGNQISEKPTSENATQINIDISSKEKLITDSSNTDSLPFPSPCTHENGAKRNSSKATNMNIFEIYREIIWENIEYPLMVERYGKEQIDELSELILETVCTARRTIRIAGDDYPAELVKSKFLKLGSSHIEFVIECMKNNTSEIRNIKKYLLAVLFNATSTIDSYYTALVSHDMASK